MTIVSKQLGLEVPDLDDLPYPTRSEREVAADAVWCLFAAGLLPKTPEMVMRACAATGLDHDDLRVASVRAERRAQRRPVAFSPERTVREREPLPAQGYVRERAPQRSDRRPPEQQRTRLTDRGRRGAAEAVFAMWRARGNLVCTKCGKSMDSGCDVEIEAAHHAGGCP